MKNLIMLAVLSAAIIVLLNSLGMVQANSPKQERATIFIGYQEKLIPVSQRIQGKSHISGLEVMWISASSNCPTVYEGEALGVVINRFLEQGFRLEVVPVPGQCMLVR